MQVLVHLTVLEGEDSSLCVRRVAGGKMREQSGEAHAHLEGIHGGRLHGLGRVRMRGRRSGGAPRRRGREVRRVLETGQAEAWIEPHEFWRAMARRWR